MATFQGALTSYTMEAVPLKNRWTDIFRRDSLIHVSIMGSIIAATFQGYLKDRMGGPIPYALSDAFFIMAVAFWFAGIAIRHEPVRGPGWVPIILLVVTLVPASYLLYPTASLAIQMAGLRSWSEFPVGCLIALTVIRNGAQARAYVSLILILCLFTAVYGIVQFNAGPGAALNVSELAQIRHGGSTFYFVPGTGRTGFRAFSTFTFPSPFAMMMVFGILLAVGRALSRQMGKGQRIINALIIPVLFVGMTVSGTRAALIILLAGLFVVAWFRRFSLVQILIIPVLIGAFHVASLLTSGGAMERFQTLLLQEGLFWTYLMAPITTAFRSLAAAPFGLGLGRSGVGVPFRIFSSQPAGFFVGSDGDIGRAAVEMGIVGIAILVTVLAGLLPYVMRAARALVGTDKEDLAFGIAPLLVSTGLGVLVGSPIASAPHGIMWWYLAGILLKLTMLEQEKGEVA